MANFKFTSLVITVYIRLTYGPVNCSCQIFPPPQTGIERPTVFVIEGDGMLHCGFEGGLGNEFGSGLDGGFDSGIGGGFESLLPLLFIPFLC